MSDLAKRLREGTIQRTRRWSGDTHADLGGTCDEEATEKLMAEAADCIESLEAEVTAWKRQHAGTLATLELTRNMLASAKAKIDVAREESEDIGYANGRADAENAARRMIEAQAAEILRLSMPKPPGYEHLSHETIDAIRATSTKPKD